MLVGITGATGFIGAPLTAALAGAGCQVRAAVRDRRRRSLPPGVDIALLPDLAGTLDWTPLVAGMDAGSRENLYAALGDLKRSIAKGQAVEP